jgi:Transglutaminase-like superfamily
VTAVPTDWKVWSNLARFRACTSAEKSTLLISAAWLPLFWLGLHLLGLARLQTLVQRPRTNTTTVVNLSSVFALGELVNTAARHTPFPTTCLTRSLLLDWLLRRRGIPSRLRIGVRSTGGSFGAHAWVECNGIPVNDRSDVVSRFEPFTDSVSASTFHAP